MLTTLCVCALLICAISLLQTRVVTTINQQAYELLGGQLKLSSEIPISTALQNHIKSLPLARSETLRTLTMASHQGQTMLVNLKAIDHAYPLLGGLTTSPNTLSSPPVPGTAWVAPRVLSALQLSLGQAITIGNRQLTVTGTLIKDPEFQLSFANISPPIIINHADVDSLGIIAPGSRITREIRFTGSATAIQSLYTSLKLHIQPRQRIRLPQEQQSILKNSFTRISQFLTLSILLSLLLAGIAISLASQSYLQKQNKKIAILRALGVKQAQIVILYCSQLLYLTLAATALGAAIAYGGFLIANPYLQHVLPSTSLPLPWQPLATTITCNILLLTGFCLPVLLQINRQSAHTLLNQSRPLTMLRGVSLLTAAIIFLLLALLLARDTHFLLKFMLSLLISVSLIFLLTRMIVWLTTFWNNTRHIGLRLSVILIQRQRLSTFLHVIAATLALTTLFLLLMLQHSIATQFFREVHHGSPNVFALDIEPRQKNQFITILDRAGIQSERLYPNTRARFTQRNQQPIMRAIKPSGRDHNVLRRTLNLTFSRELPVSNTIVDGTWWTTGTLTQIEVSPEINMAKKLGLRLGDTLTFTVGSLPLTATITSFRHINWRSLKPNYYFVFSPNAFLNLPYTLLTSFHLPAGNTTLINQLSRALPNITIIDVQQVLQQTLDLSQQVMLIIAILTGFSCFFGLLIITTLFLNTLPRRLAEQRRLTILGAPQRLLHQLLWYEYILIGSIASGMTTLLANGISYALCKYVLNIQFTFSMPLTLLAMGITPILVALLANVLSRSLRQ